MSDFSMFSLFTAGLACLLPFASAYTQPVGASPSGNPIYEPGSGSIVPAGQPFEVTWDPTTPGTVTLVLLKGPSTNAVPQYAIVEKIANSGSYSWTPSTDLVPSDGATGYGIQLIVDATGQYQYTTQFGISNAEYGVSSSSSSSSMSMSMSSTATPSSSSSSAYSAPANISSSSTWTTCTISTTANTSTTRMMMSTGTSPAAPMVTASTGMYPAGNSTMVVPTGSMSVPASLKSGSASATASSTMPAVQLGAGSTLTTSFAGLVVAAGAAVFAF